MEASRRERKVVTVLFADLVGFTARAEQLDPEDVEAILRPYHERLRLELERFGGTVEKFIGDAVMALFGAPLAHEDDPERAVRAALAIRDWARQDGDVQVRVAVNTGEALVNLDVRPESGEGMAAGDVVNTTARLQSAAPVNGVLVGEITQRATRGVIDYAELAAVKAKGKTAPIRVWEALDARSRVGTEAVSARAPLVGRDRELALLRHLLGRVREESSPQLVTLVGVPGIGKSRLVHELFRVVEDGGVLTFWRQGRSLPYGEGVTLWALAEMVKAQAGILESDDDAVAQQKLEAAVADLVADATEAKQVETQLRPLVGGGAEVTSESRTEAFAAWRRFFEAMAERRPLVLVFEDLHWADDGLVEFVDHLAEWSAAVPMLILCSARPELLERHPGWGGGKLNATTLSLSPLTDAETARLLSAILPRSVLEAQQQQELIARAGGNPLYAEQYGQMVVEQEEPGGEKLPETVQGIIAARLDRLPAAEKSLLHDAAVHGKVFWVGGVLDGTSADDVARRLHALERKGFVQRAQRSSVGAETEYAFLHVLVRDVAYGQIPRADRAAKHLAAARWIESLGRRDDHAEMLAHHYRKVLELLSAQGSDAPADVRDRACSAFADAGDRALALNAFSAAANFFESALELAADADEPLLQYRYAVAMMRMGDERRAAALERARDSLLAAGDRDRAAETEALLAEVLWFEGREDVSREHLIRAEELVTDSQPTPEKAHVLAQVARFQMLRDEYAEAVPVGESALALAESLGLEELRVDVLVTIGTAKAQSGDPSGVADLEHAVELSSGRAFPPAWRAYNNLSVVATHRFGDVRLAKRYLDEGMAVAERFGDRTQITWFRGQFVYVADELGDLDEAVRNADAIVASGKVGFPSNLEGPARAYRARTRLARDDVAGAAADADRAVALARTTELQTLQGTFSPAALVLLELGRRSEAAALADEIVASIKTKGLGGAAHSSLPAFAALLVGLGRAGNFGECAARALPGPWLVAAGAYIAGRYELAADLYANLSVPEEARARLRAAEQLVAEGRRAEADVQLQRALAFWRSVGATRYIREGEALLAASA